MATQQSSNAKYWPNARRMYGVMLLRRECLYIAGVDEVGRGPLAGPVIAAAVILREPIDGVRDSKQLTALQRTKLAIIIREQALCYAYGRVEAAEIDVLNIHNATMLAMQRAVAGLVLIPDEVLVDGLFMPNIRMPCKAIVRGDSLVPIISAASILAKVYRDAEMIELDSMHPGYGFAEHKGYPTAKHRAALNILGPCAIHRRSFAPVAACLE